MATATEKYLEKIAELGGPGWSFTTFLRYFAPGLFTAFWIALYVVRVANIPGLSVETSPIANGRDLLKFLYENWSGIVGLIVILGGFLGILFVGIDPIVRAFMGSRALRFALKYLLSSKKVDFAYFQFMRMNEMMHRYERLPKEMVLSSADSSGLKDLAQGDYSSRYFLRETVFNYFWDQHLDKDLKSCLTQRAELSSAFLYLSFSSLMLVVLQTSFYTEHLGTRIQTGVLTLFDLIPFVLVLYVLATFLYNVYYYRLAKLSAIQEAFRNFRNADRKILVTASFVAFFSFWYLLHSNFWLLPWFEAGDPILLIAYWGFFVSFYWSSTYNFSRYVITFEHCFKRYEKKIMDFLNENADLMKDMDSSYSRPPRSNKAREVKTLRDIRMRIEALQKEKLSIEAQIGNLKQMGVLKAQKLEMQLSDLRQELELLRELFDK